MLCSCVCIIIVFPPSLTVGNTELRLILSINLGPELKTKNIYTLNKTVYIPHSPRCLRHPDSLLVTSAFRLGPKNFTRYCFFSPSDFCVSFRVFSCVDRWTVRIMRLWAVSTRNLTRWVQMQRAFSAAVRVTLRCASVLLFVRCLVIDVWCNGLWQNLLPACTRSFWIGFSSLNCIWHNVTCNERLSVFWHAMICRFVRQHWVESVHCSDHSGISDRRSCYRCCCHIADNTTQTTIWC